MLLTVAGARGLLMLRSSDGVQRASQRAFFAAAAPGAARGRSGRYGKISVIRRTRQLDRRPNDPRERRSSRGLAPGAHTGRHKYTRKCCFCHSKMQFCMEARRFLAKGGRLPHPQFWHCSNQLQAVPSPTQNETRPSELPVGRGRVISSTKVRSKVLRGPVQETRALEAAAFSESWSQHALLASKRAIPIGVLG